MFKKLNNKIKKTLYSYIHSYTSTPKEEQEVLKAFGIDATIEEIIESRKSPNSLYIH